MVTRRRTRTTTQTPKMVSVGGSIGGELHTFEFSETDTIKSVFEKAGFDVDETSEVLCRQTAENVDLDSRPVANNIYYLSQKFKSQNY